MMLSVKLVGEMFLDIPPPSWQSWFVLTDLNSPDHSGLSLLLADYIFMSPICPISYTLHA